MKLKVIACKVLTRELYYLAYKSHNIIDIYWLKQALHNEPEKLRRTLQKAIYDIEAEDESYDAICLGYGLCSNGIVGIKSEKYSLIVPRAHDCITLLLGSKEKYQEIFHSRNGGIYWYSPGWIEHSIQPGKERYDMVYKNYVEKYGEDNAQYLMDMEQNWMKAYENAIYINWAQFDTVKYIEYTRQCAEFLKWRWDVVEGSDSLLRDMLEGHWDEERFLMVSPGKTIKPTYREDIISSSDNSEYETR